MCLASNVCRSSLKVSWLAVNMANNYRGSERKKSKSRSKSPARRVEEEVPLTGENSFMEALRKTRELSESKSALSNDPQRVIEKRRRQGFYI